MYGYKKLQERQQRSAARVLGGGYQLPKEQWGANFRQTLCALFFFFPKPLENEESVFYSEPDNNICKQSPVRDGGGAQCNYCLTNQNRIK